MVQPLVSLDFPTSSKPADVCVNTGGFYSTSVEFLAATEAGKAVLADMFGPGCISVNIRKSASGEFAAKLEACGLKVM